MKHRRLGLTLCLLVSAGAAQTYRAPRAPDGKPDLQGFWQALNTASYNVEPRTARGWAYRRDWASWSIRPMERFLTSRQLRRSNRKTSRIAPGSILSTSATRQACPA